MSHKPLAVYNPFDLDRADGPDLSRFAYRFLAEGDSWFTIGTLNPAKNSNLLFEMAFEQFACAVNCARPGDTLRRMSQINVDAELTQRLAGRKQSIWDGVLLSCGGNDLIDALQVVGDGIAPDRRLLLTAAEWGDASLGAARYVSEPGWQTFTGYLAANLKHFLAIRDRGRSAGCPVFVHGYAVPTPRPSGAGLGAGPWLLPAMEAYAIPETDRAALAGLFIGRLGDFFAACAADAAVYPALHFFDSRQIAVEPARAGDEGESGDWINEIHLTWRGYEKIALPWSAAIERVMQAR